MKHSFTMIAIGLLFGPAFAEDAAKSVTVSTESQPQSVAIADEPERPAPYILLRALQELQNRIALGDVPAQAGQGQLVAEIGTEFLRTPPSAWKDARNARALAIYLFSGGVPGPVRRIYAAGVVPGESEDLIRGALAYAEGRQVEARSLLGSLDPMAVPASFGAYLALIQGGLLARDEPAKSLGVLDIARLLAPGTVVEETALRRSAFIAAQMGNLDLFASFGNKYLRLYPKSVYGKDFRERLPAAVASFPAQVLQSNFKNVVPLIEELSPDQRRATYLAVARVAALRSKSEVSISASNYAAKTAEAGSRDSARADLYRAAGSLLGAHPEEAVAALAVQSGIGLSREDRELLAAARFVSDQIYPKFTDAESLPDDQRPPASDAMKLATRALADSDRLLQGSPR